MKLSTLQQSFIARRNVFRSASFLEASMDNGIFTKSPISLFWLILHGLSCLVSLVLGFRFSRIILFLLFTTTTRNINVPTMMIHDATGAVSLQTSPLSPPIDVEATNQTHSSSRVVVGRHGIHIRPWPHPNPVEVMKAHRVIEIVQKEQHLQLGIKNPRAVIAITPTYVRTFQTLHLTSLMHSLMIVPYDIVWIVVEAGGTSSETAALLAKSGLRTLHISFDEEMPVEWDARHRMEAQMRIHALRVVREQRLDGIVMFADESNIHSVELFDEIQSVKWIGTFSVGFLTHSGYPELFSQRLDEEGNLLMPVQGPTCNSSDKSTGLPCISLVPLNKLATDVNDEKNVLQWKLEWAGFVLNSRLVWKKVEDTPEWIQDLDTLSEGRMVESPLSLMKDASFVEPLGKCRKVLLWWLRSEARPDSEFPQGWTIYPPLEITIPAKHTLWPDASPELHSTLKVTVTEDHSEEHPQKSRSFRDRLNFKAQKTDRR